MCRELAGGSFGRWKLRILYLVVILMNRTNHRTNHCFIGVVGRITARQAKRLPKYFCPDCIDQENGQ